MIACKILILSNFIAMNFVLDSLENREVNNRIFHKLKAILLYKINLYHFNKYNKLKHIITYI